MKVFRDEMGCEFDAIHITTSTDDATAVIYIEGSELAVDIDHHTVLSQDKFDLNNPKLVQQFCDFLVNLGLGIKAKKQ